MDKVRALGWGLEFRVGLRIKQVPESGREVLDGSPRSALSPFVLVVSNFFNPNEGQGKGLGSYMRTCSFGEPKATT